MDILGPILILACLPLFLCCDINRCQRNSSHFVSSEMCTGLTKNIDCLKTEFSKCTTEETRSKFMIMVPYSMQMHPPSLCGYDVDSVMEMLRARTNLMMTMINGTQGVHPMMLAGDDGPFGDDGQFDDDDGLLGDDGPFDDNGPFDDGPFDDGPLDDAAENGLIHAVLAAQPNPAPTQTTEKPPPAPGLLPRFRGGAAMQFDDGAKAGVAQNRVAIPLLLSLFVMSLVVFW